MAEVYHNNIIDIDLESGTLFRSFLNHTIGSGDNNANWYGVRVFRKGEPIALSGCSVQGLFMPASGSAILISDGTHTWVSGNEAAVLLPQACYNVKGRFTLTIKIIGTNSYSITDTVRIIDGVVADTYSANPVAPTAAVPTYQEILAVYDQMVAAKDGSVRFDIEQELTAAQMTQARGNIAAASESDVSDLKSAFNAKITQNTSENIIANISSLSGSTANGITVDINDMIIDISGHNSSTSNKFYAFYDNISAMPSGLVAGNAYVLSLSKTNANADVHFQILAYNSSEVVTELVNTTSAYLGKIYIPTDTVGMRIRFYVVKSSADCTESMYPILSTVGTLTSVSEKLSDIEGNIQRLSFTTTNELAISSETGLEVVANNKYYATSLITIPNDCYRLEIFSAFSSSLAGAFYDANQAFMCGIPTNSDYNQTAYNYFVDVPKNAKYVRFTIYVSNSNVYAHTAYIQNAVYDLNDIGSQLKTSIGKEYLPATFTQSKAISNETGAEVDGNTYFYASSRITLPDCYQIEVFSAFSGSLTGAFYDENNAFISGIDSVPNGSAYYRKAYAYIVDVPVKAKYFRFTLYVSNSNVSLSTVYCRIYTGGFTEIAKQIGTNEKVSTLLLTEPINTTPAYIKNLLSYRPLGALTKGYICMVADDGTSSLANYTIQMLLEKGVPATFAVYPNSNVITNATNLNILLNAISNGCAVAMHGTGTAWPQYSESELAKYFSDSIATFAEKGITEIQGAVCPGVSGYADTSTLVQCVAGGTFGVLCSGGTNGEIWYGNDYHLAGPRTNIFAMNRASIRGYTEAQYKAAIDQAIEDHMIFIPFWHDDTIAESTEYQAILEGMIDYAKNSGIQFITLGEIPNIT